MLEQTFKAKLSLALFALVLGAPMTSHAADLYAGPDRYRAPPPYAVPYEPPAEGAGLYRPGYQRLGEFERCRIFNQVLIDPYGREVLHRVRVCDERIAARAPGWVAAPPSYGYGPHFYDAPRPARNVGPGPEFDNE